MGKPCIICVAITGSVPRKEDNPAVLITVTEQIESTQEAFEAGASICHAHVGMEDQTRTSDLDRFARCAVERCEKHERPVASFAEAREILRLRTAA